ncbi:MAG: CesT family type III secretion system chaperone [Planctomycetes bacterium]|nr:CesT family type III secretion system chaperone [Planctomycetota bacterium]
MDHFSSLLADFARRLGLVRLTPGSAGCVELLMERLGRLQLEADGDWLLVTLARPTDPYAVDSAGALLALIHWRENHPLPIHPGMRGEEWLTLTARIPLPTADVPTLDHAIEILARLHDAAGETAKR